MVHKKTFPWQACHINKGVSVYVSVYIHIGICLYVYRVEEESIKGKTWQEKKMCTFALALY